VTIVGPELPSRWALWTPCRNAACASSAHAGRGHAGDQQGFRQAIPAAAQHSHSQLRVCANLAELEKAVEFFHPPIVVKADGLHAVRAHHLSVAHTALEAARTC